MSIVKLTSTNFKRIKAVHIEPDKDGNLVIISGKNGQGKSSVLDSITAALGGTSSKTTPRPIRDGEKSAEIVLETEELIVTRKFTASGSTLTVKSHDGATYSKGQSKLDELIGKLSLDPLAFTQLDDKKQLTQLLDLVDLPFDVAALDAERAGIFKKRTEVGAEGKRIGEAVVDPSLPSEETSAGAILDAIRAGEASNRLIEVAKTNAAHWANQVDRLKSELDEAQRRLDHADGELSLTPEPVDTTELEAQLATVETTNAEIRANNSARAQSEAKEALRNECKAMTSKLDAIDKRKADGLAAATFPVEGLGFDTDGVTYNKIPFKQASTAEQIRVSLGMAMALSPKLKIVRIADGSMLDSDNLLLIEEMAREKGFQVWLEIVEGGQGFEIVDGELAE